jgi:hypothetical protein
VAWGLDDGQSRQTRIRCNDRRHMALLVSILLSFAFRLFTLTRFLRYDSCDVGTFPNQTNPDGLGPPAAIYSNASQAKYDNKLSYLSGQKASCAISAFPVINVNLIFRLARAPAQARTTLARAMTRVAALRKSMYSKLSTINWVLAVWFHSRRSSRHSRTTMCMLMTPPTNGSCSIRIFPGPTPTGMR